LASAGNQQPENRTSQWLAILRTLIVQIAVLLVLTGAVLSYLAWSSDVNWAEFVAASQTSGLASPHHPRSEAPVETTGSQAPCRQPD